MQYAQLNPDGTYSHQITTSGNLKWDENNFCSAEALIKDGKADQFNVVELHETDPPDIDSITQSVIRDGGEFVDGRWQYHWCINTLSPEQITENELAAKQTLVANIRITRNTLLKESDWTQVADAPVDKAAWATYRQALRDITEQEGFPWNVQWPLVP